MGIQHNPDTPYGRELARHEQHRTKYTSDDVPPGNPYQYREYGTSGKMLYRAVQHPKSGKGVCMDVPPNPMLFQNAHEYDRACLATEQINQSCTKVVFSESEERNAMNDGWRNSPVDALVAFENRALTLGNASAERLHADQRMSASAQAEAAAADAATHEHLGEIPAPKKRRGRKPNAPMVTVPELPATE